MHSALSKLILQSFRSYENLSLSFSKPFVVLYGSNGAGKTNILEAISLFTPGKGMRKAEFKEIQKQDSNIPWAVSIKVNENTIGTGVTAADAKKRIWFLNNEPMRTQKTLNDILRLFWITPETDRLFLDSPSKRRQFVDRMVFVLNPEHLNDLKIYEHAVKERLHILTNNTADSSWLDQLEIKIAEFGLKISKTRSLFISQLPFDNSIKAFMNGPVEKMLDTNEYLQELKKYRPRDAASGMTLFGAHKSDLNVTYLSKSQEAANCSTGEQKMILAKIIVAFLKHLQQYLTIPLLLLFDDVISHLDFSNRVLLFEQLLTLMNTKNNSSMIQVLFTSTEPDAFKAIEEHADFFEINQSKLGNSL